MNPKLNCIMLIDDDEPTNFLGSMIIEEAGCANRVEVLDSAEKALKFLDKSKANADNENYPWPDRIFLDINMPAMDGWEFLEKYNKIEKNKSGIIMVMLTTSLNPDDELKAKNFAGVTDFKHKPLTEEILKEILHTYFDEFVASSATVTAEHV